LKARSFRFRGWGQLGCGPVLLLAFCLQVPSTGASGQRSQPQVYVTNSASNTLSVVDTATNRMVATISVESSPVAVASGPDGKTVFTVGSRGPDEAGALFIIDASTYAVTAEATVGKTPSDVAVSPDGRRAYVTNLNSADLTVVDAASGAVLSTIALDGTPAAVAFAPDGETAYVAEGTGGVLFVIDVATQRVTGFLDTGFRAVDVAADPTRSLVYVVDPGPETLGRTPSRTEGSIRVVDTSTLSLVDSVPVGATPHAIAVDPVGGRAYVANQDTRDVSVLDLARLATITSVDVGSEPFHVAVTPDSRHVYVTQAFSDTISVIDTEANVLNARIDVGRYPTGLVVVASEEKSGTGGGGCSVTSPGNAYDVGKLASFLGALAWPVALRRWRRCH
jgi:YVTN family beta-propeller protein